MFFYKKNVGDITISNLHQINGKQYSISTITYSNKFTLSNNTINIVENVINIYSESTQILSLDSVNWNNLFYKSIPILLNLNISKHYVLNLYSKELEYLDQKFRNTKTSFKFDLSLHSIKSRFIGTSGTLTEIQNIATIQNIASMLKIPLSTNIHKIILKFIPIHFNVENKNSRTDINVTGSNITLNVTYKPQKIRILSTLYENNRIDCTISIKNNINAKCNTDINNFLYGNTIIKKFQSDIFINFKSNNINFVLSDPIININFNNVNVVSKYRTCRIKGTLIENMLSVKATLQKKCKFFIAPITMSPISLQLLYQNKKYVMLLFANSISFRNNSYPIKLKNTYLSADIFTTPNNIESNFTINTKVDNFTSLFPNLKNIIPQVKKVSVSGKANFSTESESIEFSNLYGNIDNIKINDGVFIINNKQEISFINIETEYKIQLDNYLYSITNIGINDFHCNSYIKTVRKTPRNFEILGSFSNCELFFNDFVQAYNTSGFWRFLIDTKLENMEFSATANNGTIAIPMKQYDLSKDHIVTIFIPVKRTANIVETHTNISFIPQNEYINIDLFTFIQQKNKDLLLTSQGEIKSNIKSNNFLSQFSLQTNLNIETMKFDVQQFKTSFFINMKNIVQLKNSFQELFDFVNIQGYFATRGRVVIKNNKIDAIDGTLSFIIPKLTLDNIQISKIRGKIPINIQLLNNNSKTKIGYVRFSIDKPIKINFSATVNNITPPCIFIKSIRIKYTSINVISSKFKICVNPYKQTINAFDIPIEKISISISTIKYLSKILSAISTSKGICNVRLNNATFDCTIPFNIVSNYFSANTINVTTMGKYKKSLDTSYELSGNFNDINLENLLKNFGFQESLTGKYNLHIDKLKVANGMVNEVKGYIENIDTETKKISSIFLNSLAKELFNIKIKDIKMEKNFNNLGLYFHYIKEKLIIKPLYYLDNNKIKKYLVEDFKNRHVLLKSKGKKDCMIYGKGRNTITLCTKGGIIISIDKLLKLKDILLPYFRKDNNR